MEIKGNCDISDKTVIRLYVDVSSKYPFFLSSVSFCLSTPAAHTFHTEFSPITAIDEDLALAFT